MSYTIKLLAGFAIANRCAVVTRGTKTPLSVAVKSSMDDGLGLIVPIPTLFCAKVAMLVIALNSARVKIFFIRCNQELVDANITQIVAEATK